MRAALCLAFAFSGCLVSERTDDCSSGERCEPRHVEAPFVLGKPDADSNWYTHGMYRPSGVTVLGGMLFVSDRDNHRILVWKTWPSRSYQGPDLVIGQKQLSLLESGPSNNAVVSPRCLTGDATRLWVGTDLPTANAVPEHNRLLQFGLPLKQNFPANQRAVNIGNMPGSPTANNFALPSPVLVGNSLAVADRGFHRVLLFSAADSFVSGANKALGQTSLDVGMLSGPTSSSLNSPQGCPATDGKGLVVPDTGNHRVLLYGLVSTLLASTMANPPALYVLGQMNFGGGLPNRGSVPAYDTMSSPIAASVGSSGGDPRLVVADRDNNRVLLWDSLPSASNVAANRVLGQGDGASVTANPGGVSLSTLNAPGAVYTNGESVAVADTENHRVLLWNRWPTMNARPADLVLGQASGTQNQINGNYASANSFLNPQGLARVGDGLAVADRGFNRVLIWPKLPLSPQDPPTLVLGQSDLTGSAAYGGAGGPVADGLRFPSRVASDGQSLAVWDSFGGLSRVLVWKALPTRSKQPADIVLGRASFTDLFGSGDVQTEFNGDGDVALFKGRVYLVDGGRSRVLIWRSMPTQNNQLADVVLGQTSLMNIQANQGGSAGANTLSNPRAIFVDEGHIYVADTGNHRILVWNTNDPSTNQPADRVIGPADFSDTQGCVPGRLCSPQALSVLGSRLYVTEMTSHRVLSWPSLSPPVGQAPDRVYGQPDLSTNSANLGRLAIDRLNTPTSVVATDRALYISDGGNGRVVVLPPNTP